LKINTATFVISAANYKDCPKPNQPEYAFIGRSNVGKSSLINMLTGRKKLAKTSVTPGKTQLINHFMINNSWYLADLPGYGYAKASKVEKAKWGKMNSDYLLNRTNLLTVFLLIDSRHEPQKIDSEFIQWLGENGLPFLICFTKADKLSSTQVAANIAAYKDHLEPLWDELPKMVVTSAIKHLGKEETLNYIENTNKVFKSNY
jgi:GTP-binding protein